MNEAQVLAPGRDVQVGDETVRVEPIRGLRRTIEAAGRISPLLKALNRSGALMPKEDATALDAAIAWVDVLAAGGDDALRFLAFALGKPLEWIEEREIDEVVKLGRAVFEENRDFFGQRVLPLIAPAQPPADGPTSSES